MRAGQLNRRVSLQAPMETRNDLNEVVTVYRPYATVWGAVLPLRGREFWLGAQEQQQVTTRIVVRYRDDVSPSHQVVYKDHVYDVMSVIDKESKHVFLELMCKERVNH